MAEESFYGDQNGELKRYFLKPQKSIEKLQGKLKSILDVNGKTIGRPTVLITKISDYITEEFKPTAEIIKQIYKLASEISLNDSDVKKLVDKKQFMEIITVNENSNLHYVIVVNNLKKKRNSSNQIAPLIVNRNIHFLTLPYVEILINIYVILIIFLSVTIPCNR